jgi:S-DNA-T family DNA segregation ATPase FtsK/SpoIIIE
MIPKNSISDRWMTESGSSATAKLADTTARHREDAREMQVLVTVFDATTQRRANVYLDVDPHSAIGEIFPTLVRAVAADAPVQMDTPIRESGLREGAWVSLLGADGAPMPKITAVGSAAQIKIVSGRKAGTVFHCASGAVTVGAYGTATIATRAAENGAILLELRIDEQGRAIAIPAEYPHGTPPLFHDQPLERPVELSDGDQIVFSDCIVEFGHQDATGAALEADAEDGTIKYNRPPRILPPEPEPKFTLPSPPVEPTRQPLPIIAALLPLLMGIVMAYAFQNPRMLLFGLFSPVMIISSFITRTRFGHKRHREQTAEYEDEKRRVRADAEEAVVTERARRRTLAPDPAEIGRIATLPTPRLWERRPSDAHWLELRFGTANQPSSVSLEDPEELEHKRVKKWDVFNVPATVNLREAGAVGIAGAENRARLLGQWAVAQLGALHSPRDAQIYLLSSEGEHRGTSAVASWDFLAWLPHAKPAAGQDALRTVGTSTQTLATRLAELTMLLDARAEAMTQNSIREWSGSSIIAVIDGSHRLRSMPGIVRLLREGPGLGIYSLCLDSDERLLPEECDTVVLAEHDSLTIRRQRSEDLREVMPDWITQEWCDWVARAIAPVVDASPGADDAAIPDSSRLLDVLALDPPRADEIRARWSLNPGSTRAVVGESLDGAFSLDIASDGPHGLIAGTTGSGKSELLQTIVASLAAANTPESMTFVLVDYKGGAAFKDCVDLPHTVGMVTDLDTHLVSRALDSLGAELKYREHVLAQAGAKDLDDYLDLVGRNSELPKIPRLLIVIDEFASLARELPSFVSGLVNIAQRGRSLGIHLILATQRPSGVVSPEIRANTNLRIALRVTDSSESVDVINGPEAANIAKSTPGRAYVRLGSQSLIPFQAGRVGGRAPDYGEVEDQRIDPLVRPLSFEDLAESAPVRHAAEKSARDVEVTDLKILVQEIRAANRLAGFAPPRKPWLPALGTEVVLAGLLVARETDPSTREREILFGMEDHPQDQVQRPLSFVPASDGHLYVVGAARSGKTAALRTLALSGALTFGADELHIHAIDCGNGGLLPLQALPHVGTVVQRHQVEQVTRLLHSLRDELGRRQQLLAGHGCADLAELESVLPGGERPAHLLLLIDSWDGFLNALEDAEGGRLVETVHFLLREGAATGMHVVISGDRQLITGRMSLLASRKIVLRLIEKTDFTQIGVNPRTLPDELPEGRGYSSEGGTEVQIALVAPGTNSQQHAAHIREVASQLTEREREVTAERRPFTIAEMPTQLTRRDAEAQHGNLEPREHDIFLGVGGRNVQPHAINPILGLPTFVIAGPAKSGRTTTLHSIAHTALKNGYELVLAVPRKNPLRELEGRPGVIEVFTDAAELTEKRLSQLLTDRPRPTLFLADDADLLRQIDADMWLRGMISKAQEHRLGLVIAGDSEALGKGFTGWLVEMKKNRHGLLFAPQSMTDGDVTGVRLKRSDVGAAMPAGRGHFTGDTGEAMLLQVALP